MRAPSQTFGNVAGASDVCMSETAVRMDMFVGSMLQQVLESTRPPEFIHEVLAVLQLKDGLGVKLHFAEYGVLDFLRVEDHVHVQVERALALADLVLQPHDLEVLRMEQAFVRADHVLCRLADVPDLVEKETQ